MECEQAAHGMDIAALVRDVRLLQGSPRDGSDNPVVARNLEAFAASRKTSELVSALRQFVPECKKMRRNDLADMVRVVDANLRQRASEAAAAVGVGSDIRSIIDCRIRGLLSKGAEPVDIPAQAYYDLMLEEGISMEKIRACLEVVLAEHREQELTRLRAAIAWNGTPLEKALVAIHDILLPAMRHPHQANLAAHVLVHWMKNAKLKLAGQIELVEQHVCPVFFSPQQNTGKSKFVLNLCKPFNIAKTGELGRVADLEQLTDERHWVALGKTPLVFLDEMSKIRRSDAEMIKSFVTSAVLTPRLLYTNKMANVPNMCSLIGTSNCSSVGELIGDTTGVRRFFGIEIKTFIGVTAIDFDGTSLWQMVNPEWPNFLPAEFLQHQEFERPRTVVEDFISQCGITYSADGTWYSTTELQLACTDFAKKMGRQFSLSVKAFSQEVALRLGHPSENGGSRNALRGFRILCNDKELALFEPFRGR